MIAWKTSLATLLIVCGLGGSALAQQGNAPARGYAPYPGAGTNGDYYSITSSFGPYGLPGTYPRYQGYGLSGYGQGSILNEYFVPWPGPKTPQASMTLPKESKPATKSPVTAKKSNPRSSNLRNSPRK